MSIGRTISIWTSIQSMLLRISRERTQIHIIINCISTRNYLLILKQSHKKTQLCWVFMYSLIPYIFMQSNHLNNLIIFWYKSVTPSIMLIRPKKDLLSWSTNCMLSYSYCSRRYLIISECLYITAIFNAFSFLPTPCSNKYFTIFIWLYSTAKYSMSSHI